MSCTWPVSPSIDPKVSFAFDSARLETESLITPDVLGPALASEALRDHAIEIVGHTDARGASGYNEAQPQR